MSDNIVLIISGAPIYHQKGAAYERILNYARALALKECKIYLCSTKYEEHQIINKIQNNVFFLGTRDSTRKKQNNFLSTIKYFRSIRHFLHDCQRNISVLTFPSDFLTDLLILMYFKYFLNFPVYCEKNELKIGMRLNAYSDKALWKRIVMKGFFPLQFIKALIYDFMLPFYNGVISISTRMKKIVSKVNRTIRIPIIVDAQIFGRDYGREDSDDHTFTMGYFGSISQKKDGILDFLTAINHVKKTGYSWRINLYGDISPYMRRTIHAKYHNEIQDGKIKIIPSVEHNQIPYLMTKHDLLLLPRPSNLQTEYGFSTKLAEYMASGVPVLVTDVSDNGLYVKEGENGFSVQPGDLIAMAKKLREIFHLDHNHLRKIGLKGRETAIAQFDYKNYSDTLFNFICRNGT